MSSQKSQIWRRTDSLKTPPLRSCPKAPRKRCGREREGARTHFWTLNRLGVSEWKNQRRAISAGWGADDSPSARTIQIARYDTSDPTELDGRYMSSLSTKIGRSDLTRGERALRRRVLLRLHLSHLNIRAPLAVTFFSIRHFNVFALLMLMILAVRSPFDVMSGISCLTPSSVPFFTNMFQVMFPVKTGTVLLAFTAVGVDSVCFALVLFVISGLGLRRAQVLGASLPVQRAVAQGLAVVQVRGSNTECEDSLV